MADNITIKDGTGATVTLASKDLGAGVEATKHVIVDTSGTLMLVGDTAANGIYVRPCNGTQSMPSADAAARALFAKITDGSNTLPTMDVAARKGFVIITDGTRSITVGAANAALDETATTGLRTNAIAFATDAAAGGGSQLVPLQVTSTAAPNLRVQVYNAANAQPAGDVAARKIYVTLTDGTGTAGFDNSNTTPKVSLYGKGTAAGDTAVPSGDTQGHGINVIAGDGTNVAAVKAASTGSALTDKALVVAPSANCPLSKPTAGSPIRVSAKTSIKGSAGSLFGLTLINTTGSTRWVQFFDAATTGAVTLGATLPDLEVQVAANSTLTVPLPTYGWPFGLGLIYAATTAEGGATPGSAGDVLLFPAYA